ncbi:hypothetical protein SFRURICE_010565 [Spodoptera frugiperda]|nr:hypothetical protein SFRURICE_010565 [Spodoptera frugiperda]
MVVLAADVVAAADLEAVAVLCRVHGQAARVEYLNPPNPSTVTTTIQAVPGSPYYVQESITPSYNPSYPTYAPSIAPSFPGPMAPIIIDDDDDDNWHHILYYLIFAMRNRRGGCGCGGACNGGCNSGYSGGCGGNCNGGCGGGCNNGYGGIGFNNGCGCGNSCGGNCGVYDIGFNGNSGCGCSSSYIPYPIPYPLASPFPYGFPSFGGFSENPFPSSDEPSPNQPSQNPNEITLNLFTCKPCIRDLCNPFFPPCNRDCRLYSNLNGPYCNSFCNCNNFNSYEEPCGYVNCNQYDRASNYFQCSCDPTSNFDYGPSRCFCEPYNPYTNPAGYGYDTFPQPGFEVNMASAKFVVFAALLIVLNMHWAQCQFYPGYGGYYPQVIGRDNDNDLDTILPILILAMFGRNGGLGCNGGGCGCGGCGGGCGCGCGQRLLLQNNTKYQASIIETRPTRYKVTSKPNANPTQGFPSEYFPEVEYPESIADSSKPFYMSSSPFSDDVKSSFNSLIAQGNKPKPEKSQEKLSLFSQKAKEVTDTKGNEINSNNTSTNETVQDDTILDLENDTVELEAPSFDNSTENLFTNGSKTNQSIEDIEEWGLVAELLKDLDEFVKNITIIEEEFQDGDNTTVESETDESEFISPNNETIVEFDGNSFHSEGHDQIRTPLFEGLNDTNDTAANITSLLNENTTDSSTVEDMQTCRHCMPRTPRKSALLNNLNPAKNNPLSTPFPPTRTDKTSKQTFGKTNQNARISKNPFRNESIFKKKHNFPENDFPLDTTPRDPFQLKTNFNNYQANRAKANSLRNTQSSIINEMKKERKMKRKLQSNAQLNNDINQPTKEMNPTTFTSGSVNTLLDPQAFPDIQYPLNTMETWEPMYWNSFSLAPPTPFDGLETPRSKPTINENIKYPSTRMTKTKARQFLKSYDKIKEENKRTSTDNSKRSNAGQSGLSFKKTATSEKASDDFITASLLEKDHKKSSVTNVTVESTTGETPNSDTQDICPISDSPVNTEFNKSNRSETATKTTTNTLKYSKISLLTEALAAIEDILNSDETNTSVSAENYCAIPEEHINNTCNPIRNETTSTGRIDYIEVVENSGNNLQPSTNSSDEAVIACEELLEAEIDGIPVSVLQSNISSLLEETNIENFTIVESMMNVETQAPTVGIEAFSNKLNQTLTNQAAPGPTSIIIIPINNNAVGPPQSHMIDTTGNAPIIVYIPSTQSNDVPSQTMFGQQNISLVSSNKTVPNNELNNDLSNTAPLLNDNPASTALVSELLDDISNSESSLPMCEPLPINSMCYNNESSQSSIKEKPFLNNATHKSINDMKLFVNSSSNEKSFDDESADIRDDINTEKTLPQVLDSQHPIFDFPGSEVTGLSDGPYNNIDNELPILPREIDSSQVHAPSEQQFVTKDNATLDDHQLDPKDAVESNLLPHDVVKTINEGFMPESSKGDINLPIVVPTEPIHVSLLPVDESIQSIPLSENLGAMAKPADKTIPTPASEAHTSIPIELSLSPSPTTNLFDKRIIIDVKLVPIEDTGDAHHSMKTVQDSLPLPPDVLSSQSKTDKLSERQDHIDSIVYYEPSRTRNNFQEQRYEMLHSTPYLEANYNLASSYEEDESKPHLVNNLVAPIPNTDPSHGNIELTTKDMKDLPLRIGILLPDFSELMEDEPISYNMPKIEHSEESTKADISNDLPIKMLDHLPLSRPINEFDRTLLPAEVMDADDVSQDTPEGLIQPTAVPKDELILEATKPIESEIKIDEVTNKSVTPVGESAAGKDEIESMYRNFNDNKSLSPPRMANSLAEAGPVLVDHSPLDVNSDILVNLPLPTDISSLTSKLLVTKALLDNVLADINNTYNTGVLSPSTEAIPISIPLANTNTAVEIPPSGPNSLLSSEEVFPNRINDTKKVSLNTLPITNLDECNSTDNTTNSLGNFTLPEDTCPLIPTSEFPPSKEQVNNETIQTEPTHNGKKSVDEIDNASFPKICSGLSSDTAVPDRLLLINGPLDHTGVEIDIPHANEDITNSQEFIHINDSKDFEDTLPGLDTPIDQTIKKEDKADNPNLPSHFNVPIFKSIDDIPTITVTKDLLESVLLDIFTKRLSLPLTQTNEDTPSLSERTTHHLESTGNFEEDSIMTSLLGQLGDTKPTLSVLEKPVLDTANTDTTNDSLLMQVDKSSSTVLDDDGAEILNSLKEEISDEGINSLFTAANQTPSEIVDHKQDIRDYWTSKDHTDELSLSKNKNILTISSSDSPDYDNEPLKQITPSSSEITITKELLESVLTDVLRKELLLPRAQGPADISPLILTSPPNDKETPIPNAIDNSLKENNEASLSAPLVNNPADLTDTSFNMSPNQSSIQLDDNIQHQENNLPLVDYIDDEQSKSEQESMHAANNEAIQLPTTIKIPLQNTLKDISSGGFTLSVVESAASPSTIETGIPNNTISGTPLEHVDNNIPNTQTVDSLDSPIDHEIIEIHEHESTITPTNDKTLPIDEIIISVPNDDVFSPKSPSELRITKALLENVLMDIFTMGLSGLVEKRLHVPSVDDITNKSPIQVLEVSSNTAHADQSRDNLAFIKETEINLPVALSDTTVNEISSKIPIDNSNISTFDKEKENNNENVKTTMPLENDDDERSSIKDTKIDSNKNIYEDNMPSTEKEKYSTSKLTITKALLENLLTDILTKGLSLPEEKPSPLTSPTALDKTLYYTETPIPDTNNETPLIEEEEEEDIPLDISLVGEINNDSIITENSKDTLPTGDQAILDTPSIDSYTDQNTEVIDKDQNHNNNLALKEYNNDLSPLNEGISEPRTVPVASRSVLDKTLYVVDNIQANRKQTAPKPIDETFEISTENSNLYQEENNSILEQDSDEITRGNSDLDVHSKESFEEIENNSEDLSKDAEEMASLENTFDDLSLMEDIHDVIEEIPDSPEIKSKRILYSKLPSTKALLEKILLDITNGGILG